MSVYPECAGSHTGNKAVLDFLELELQAVANSVIWVLGGEPRPSAGLGSAIIH